MGHYPEEYRAYLVYFHAERDYFECHEILEEYWKSNPQDPLAPAWVGLIQLAVGLYHERRSNTSGALKMLNGANSRLTEDALEKLGIEAGSSADAWRSGSGLSRKGATFLISIGIFL
ncbi:DUF309 domain-containing protein [Paenibacillus sp. CC-CFT747]|nr:DUF309 domain-containing protein [Paenibacillus sp. CC-CFT747]